MILNYIIKRLLLLIFILISVSFLVFISARLIPGDPAKIMLGERATPEAIKNLRNQLGLDKPWYTQYFMYVSNITRGDFGRSIFTNNPVLEDVAQKFPATIELAFASILIALPIGVITGMLAAVYRNTWIDSLSMIIAIFGVSMPIFWLGLILMLLFANWLPLSGRLDITSELEPITNFYILDSILRGRPEIFLDALKHLILPAITLATIPTSIIARMTRTSMLEVLNQDYIRTAYAKGVSKIKVVLHHALKNAAIPITTITGLQLGLLLSGAVITETVFAWNGLGYLVVDAVLKRDFPVVQGGVLVFACIFVLINLVVDLTYFFLDPRIRITETS